MAEAVRLNLGCGRLKLEGYVNIDDSEEVEPDVVSGAVEYLAALEPNSVDEIYAGHFLEHLEYEDGQAVLKECFRVLKSGGMIGVVVPDTGTVMAVYIQGKASLHEICRDFLYSTVQPSRHKWSYDGVTLRAALQNAGFVATSLIDRYEDPRVIPAWFQIGWDAEKP